MRSDPVFYSKSERKRDGTKSWEFRKTGNKMVKEKFAEQHRLHDEQIEKRDAAPYTHSKSPSKSKIHDDLVVHDGSDVTEVESLIRTSIKNVL